MALPAELGQGGTGFHGDEAVRVRQVLESVATAGTDIAALQDAVVDVVALVNELKTDHNGLLAALDADGGLNNSNYAASYATSAASVTYTP